MLVDDPHVSRVLIERCRGSTRTRDDDLLAVESPLEICVEHGEVNARARRRLSLTMRTPGHDDELAVGFLFSEGLIERAADLVAVTEFACDPASSHGGSVVEVSLRPGIAVGSAHLERHFVATSSCGVCGKASLEGLDYGEAAALPAGGPLFEAMLVHELPRRALDRQAAFAGTGGLHAAALFDAEGRLTLLREDVGRHNAVDKLVGRALLDGLTPLSNALLFVSGRASYELMQKAIAGGIPILAAVGAPSTLAVEVARRAGATLLGFVRDGRFNVYSGSERIVYS